MQFSVMNIQRANIDFSHLCFKIPVQTFIQIRIRNKIVPYLSLLW